MQKRKKKGHLAAKEENSPVPKLPLESVINIIKYLLSITKHPYIQGKKESNIFKNKNVNISYHIHLDFSSFFFFGLQFLNEETELNLKIKLPTT